MNIKQLLKADGWQAAFVEDPQPDGQPHWFVQDLIAWGLHDDGQVTGLLVDERVLDAESWPNFLGYLGPNDDTAFIDQQWRKWRRRHGPRKPKDIPVTVQAEVDNG